MHVRVFVQRSELTFDLPELLRATRRYFDSTLNVLAEADDGSRIELHLQSPKHGYEGRFSLVARTITEQDLIEARAAEQRGRAAGMAGLAERCTSLWEVHETGAPSPIALLNLCGILASVALGPVLPDDGSTLYGVRGAMERVERALASRGNQ